MSVKPFFINSNICLCESDISSFDEFMNSIAGNTGNSYITYSLLKELNIDTKGLRHIKNIYSYDFSNMDNDVHYINNECTHVFFMLQDQIRVQESYGLKLPYENIIAFLKKVKKPVVIAGLGANSFDGFDKNFHKKLSNDLVCFLKFLSEKSNEIGVRGCFTEEVLHNLGIKNVRVIGCPSFYEMGKDRKIAKKNKIDIKKVLLSSNYYNKLLKNNYQICQDFCEESIIKSIAFDDYDNVTSNRTLNRILKEKYGVFSSIDDWKNYVSNFDFTIGYRLHGSILSLNAGVPALCCNVDSRAREMCEFLKIPYNSSVSKRTDITELYDLLDIDTLNNTYLERYENFRDFIIKNTGINIYTESENMGTVKQPSLSLYKTKPNMFKQVALNINVFKKRLAK